MHGARRILLVAVTLVTLAAAERADADEVVRLQLRSGAAFEGRIAASDESGLTLKPAGGGEFRLKWADLDAPSWLAAKRAIADPKDGRALLGLARFAADNGMRADAEALAARAVKADPALEQEAKALEPRIRELRRAEAEALFQRGQALLEKGQHYQALGRFREAIAVDPAHALAVNGVGEAYYYLRRLKECRQYVEEAIRLDPACKDALFNRAMLDLQELDFRACLEGLDRVLALAPAAGRFGKRAEVFEEGKRQGIEKPEDAWKKLADGPLVQANDFRPVIQGIVDGPGFAQEFRSVTEHYDLRTDVSQEYADTVTQRMELIHDEYDRRYGYERTGEQKSRGAKKLRFPVIVFKERQGYAQWFAKVLQNPQMAAATGGVYINAVKHLVFFQGRTFDDTQLVAWHEGFHQFLDYYLADAPLWFNEGQAEYYGASRLDKTGRKVLPGQSAAWRVGELEALLSRSRLQPAAWLMRCARGDFMRLPEPKKEGATGAPSWHAGENYAASWALVHFCLEGEGRRWAKSLLAYFKALCDGADQGEAFEKVWGRVDWKAFDAKFRAHAEWLVARARAEQAGKEPPPAPK